MSLSAFQLNGKNALVTGSRRGLCAAMALALAEAGANVACHGRDSDPGTICADILIIESNGQGSASSQESSVKRAQRQVVWNSRNLELNNE